MYLILGYTGMLGSEICKLLNEHGEEYKTIDTRQTGWYKQHLWPVGIGTVINCVGALKDATIEQQLYANAQVPTLLREHFKGRIVYISTDCVFSGNRTGIGSKYHATDTPDPIDTYGITKRIGETQADLVIRTSFIGHKHGLLRWAIDHKDQRVDGWTKARWTGSTVDIVAANILAMADNPLFTSIHHLSTPQVITKYHLLEAISRVYELDLDIVFRNEPYINRALEPTQSITWDIESALEHYLENNPIMTGVK